MLLPYTIVLTSLLIVFGIMSGMTWLALLMSVVLFLYVPISGDSKKDKAPAAGSGPIIRPIVIRKKYVGPASIYPADMQIKVAPMWEHHNMWQKADKGFLAAISSLSKLMGVRKD